MNEFFLRLISYLAVCLCFWLAACFVYWGLVPVDPVAVRVILAGCVFLALLPKGDGRERKQ